MEGSSLTHRCVTMSTCDLRLSVKNVPKTRSQNFGTFPKFRNVPKISERSQNFGTFPNFGNFPKLVHKLKNIFMHLSSLVLLLRRFLLSAGATRSLGATNNNLQRQFRMPCLFRYTRPMRLIHYRTHPCDKCATNGLLASRLPTVTRPLSTLAQGA